MNHNRKLFIQTSTVISSMNQKLTDYGKCCMQNNQLPNQNSGRIKG